MTDKCRDEFEKWAENVGIFRKRVGAFIKVEYFDMFWECWKAAQPKWLPIATAPKDGTQFIGFLRIKNEKTGQYYDRVTLTDWFEPAYNSGEDGFYFNTLQGNYRWEPTHWMPLPQPPEDVK